MRGQDDRRAAGKNALHELPEISASLWVEPGGWFVKKNELWTIYERDGEQQALPLTTRQFSVVAIKQLTE